MGMQNRLQHLSDAEVVEIAQLGNHEAYDELVHRFRGAVLMVAGQNLRSRQAAEDVAQEAFLLAFRSLAGLREPAKFPGWLYAITRRRAQQVAQREHRSQATDDSVLERLVDTHGQPGESGPLERLLEKERQSTVQCVLAGLTPEIQTVVQLFYYEQWTAARIAAFLSLPLTTIKWRLHTAKQQISRRITGLLEEKSDVRTGCNQRGAASAPPAAENGRTGRARGTDRKL